ncbi:MAG: PIN domain-containing protein [Deltaproteobacteria bacterium]|nr:PIN domain-containing protein [Deltaproteobacteria bacterium]
MSARYLIDTNLLVYPHDLRETTKRERAKEVLRRVGSEPSAKLPAQALSEFASVALRKLEPPMSPDEVYAQVENLERAFPVLHLTPAVVLEAVRAVKAHRLSYWDAQIWAAAKLDQIEIVLTEDFDSGSVLEGVEFLDPFSADFDPATL